MPNFQNNLPGYLAPQPSGRGSLFLALQSFSKPTWFSLSYSHLSEFHRQAVFIAPVFISLISYGFILALSLCYCGQLLAQFSEYKNLICDIAIRLQSNGIDNNYNHHVFGFIKAFPATYNP